MALSDQLSEFLIGCIKVIKGKNDEFCLPSLQATFEKLEIELKEVNTNAEALKRNYLELTELKHILRKTQVFFDEVSDEIIFFYFIYYYLQVMVNQVCSVNVTDPDN